MSSSHETDLSAFRSDLREWLEAHCPPAMRTPIDPAAGGYFGGRSRGDEDEDKRRWCEAMASRGYTAPRWPREYGGGGLSRAEAEVLHEELRRIKARPALSSIGIMMLGPMLLEMGTEEQKQEHIPPMVRGEIRWCQGYSEPGAGSDLANVQTRCEDRGDHYVLTGQKIWTSYADKSDMIFCLVRTDPSAPKHEGISFILVDMDQPGVTTSPIQLISGSSPFCQTFFEEARAEKRNLVGEPGQGWTIAKRLLQFERQSIGQIDRGAAQARGERAIPDLARDYCGDEAGRIADPLLRDAVARLEMDRRALASTMRRVGDEAQAGAEVGTTSSIFKLAGTEINQRKHELLNDIQGLQALGWEGDGFSQEELDNTRHWLRSKANTIEGGTSEVQLNIIAKRVLGLPD